MLDVHVIEDPAAASVALDPVRSRLLSELRRPASAAMVAERLGMPRQKVNFRLRTAGGDRTQEGDQTGCPAFGGRRRERSSAGGTCSVQDPELRAVDVIAHLRAVTIARHC
jgi:hypothetical protein